MAHWSFHVFLVYRLSTYFSFVQVGVLICCLFSFALRY